MGHVPPMSCSGKYKLKCVRESMPAAADTSSKQPLKSVTCILSMLWCAAFGRPHCCVLGRVHIQTLWLDSITC